MLDDPNKTTSLVPVSAVIPPGARKGEVIDVQISLPEESKTTSLKGGVLLTCELRDFDTTGNLKSMVKDGRPTAPEGGLILGSLWAKAEGPLVAGAMISESGERSTGDDLEAPSLKVGRIWGGGKVTQERPYYFMMKPGDQNIRMAANVAERLNSTFFGSDPTRGIAEAKTRELVTVKVPYVYRHNHHRFLLVARQVPINPVSNDSPYRKKLEEELHDPATTITAAIKLEALGTNMRHPLRVALNNTSPWVRFAAAESLAYLGHTDGAAELAQLAQDHPALRAQCLKALAASDDAAFTDRLVELMASSDPVLRYGAFIALRLSSETNSAVAGRLLNQSVWMHRVAPGSPGLVHIASDRRAEIVVFGDGVKFTGPFTLPIGADYTASMGEGDTQMKLTKLLPGTRETDVKELTCEADVSIVLATLAKMGGGFAESIELLKRADAARCISSAVVMDALPRQFSAQQLAAFAKNDPGLIKANVEVAKVGTVRTDLEAAGVDFHSEVEDAKPETPVRQPLSQRPGRIFGPKAAEPAPGEPLQPVIPASGTEPPEPAPLNPELSRNPGRLFPRK
jgi:hypothetical protein